MLSKEKLLAMALRCIPPSEKALGQMVTLVRGDLYFISSTRMSWFVIRRFLNTDLSFKTTVDDMRTILSMGADVRVERIDGSNTRLRFSSGTARLDCGVLADIELPPIDIPDVSRFTPVPEVFKKAARFNSISGDNLRMSTLAMEDDSLVYVIDTRTSICGICYTGDTDVVNSNFTNNYDAINTVALENGKYLHSRDTMFLYMNPDGDGTPEIISCMRVTPPLATQEVRNLLSRFIVGKAWAAMTAVKVTISVSRYLEIINMVSRLSFNGEARFSVSDNTMNVRVTDSFTRLYNHSIPCEASGPVVFDAFMVPSQHVRVITSVDTTEKKEDAKMDIYIISLQRKMIITSTSPEEEFYPFILYPIRLPQ